MTDFFMGCDVSKGYADFVVLNSREQVVERSFQLDDTFDGHNTICEFLNGFFKRYKDAVLYVGVESTGGYENNWFALFSRLGAHDNVKAVRLNPLAVKAHHNASMRRIVTDDISALNIATYLIAYKNRTRFEQDTGFESLRKQWKLTEMLKKQHTQLLNQLGFLMYQSNPQLVHYCKDGVPRWILLLLSSYPTAAKLARAKAATVAKIPYISDQRAQSLINDAAQSVAAYVDETAGFIIKELVKQIMALADAIQTQKNHMENNCAIKEVARLCTINGIASYSAIGLLINIVAVERFSTVKKLAAYFGIHPVYRQSGDGEFGFHMSKKGRVEPRAILYMAVLSAINSNPVIAQLYKHCVSNGMEKKAAIGVCMHKLLRIIYGMLRTHTDFDPKVDEQNHKNAHRPAATSHLQKKRRFQQIDPMAPISKRQTKTRNEKGKIPEPHKNDVLKCGVIQDLPVEKNIISRHETKSNFHMPVPVASLVAAELERYELVTH